jgi:EAL domain-containing protein (putative c-di-GMP-specific phosphodiesterase class I)
VLRRYGCDGLQGYLVARPMLPSDVPGFLAEWRAQHPVSELEATETATLPFAETR